MFIQCRTSLTRITKYLETDNVIGLPREFDLLPEERSVRRAAVDEDKCRTISDQLPSGSIVFRNVTIAWREVQQHAEEEEADGTQDHNCLTSSLLNCVDCGQNTQRNIFAACCYKKPIECANVSVSAGGATQCQQMRFHSLPAADDDADPEEARSSVTKAPLAIVLTDVSLHIASGSLVVIIGSTGSGKSSLLQGLLGEALILQGTRQLAGNISFSSQSSWILNDTLRENILFGAEYDQER